jgi:HPt (histidine-containing phosphotransfer) domain-containing protein
VQNRLERYEILLQKFIASSINDLNRLRAAAAGDDRPAVASAAHSLRGAAAVVGATTIEDSSQAVENAVRQRCTPEELQRAIQTLEGHHAALASAVATVAAAAPTPH